MDVNDFVFVDETGVNIAMARTYARARKGVRVQASKPYNKGQNITVLGALSLEGVLAPMTVDGGTDTEVFSTYVKDMLAPALRTGNVVLMDNLSSHKVEGIQEAIEAVGATLEYLPPYSPDLSPIEECWSKVKATLRTQAARTRDKLDVAMAYALQLITPEDAKGWFAHCGYV